MGRSRSTIDLQAPTSENALVRQFPVLGSMVLAMKDRWPV
jgi:hypothetical protein